MRRQFVYVAGPYMGTATHDYRSYFTIHRNITNAHEAAVELMQAGYGVFCPHTHSAHNELIAPDLEPGYWYEIDLHFLRACDAMLVLPGISKGVDKEICEMVRLGRPVYLDKQILYSEFPPFVEM